MEALLSARLGAGPKSLKLYNYIVSIQKGEIEDPFGWITYVE